MEAFTNAGFDISIHMAGKRKFTGLCAIGKFTKPSNNNPPKTGLKMEVSSSPAFDKFQGGLRKLLIIVKQDTCLTIVFISLLAACKSSGFELLNRVDRSYDKDKRTNASINETKCADATD